MLNLGKVSMVRPNVSWLFFDKLSVMRKDEQLMFTLVGTGNCSLPSVMVLCIDRSIRVG